MTNVCANSREADSEDNGIDSQSNIAKVGYLVEQGQAEHPLQGLTIAQTGGKHGPLADDVYDLPPGMVSRERMGMK